MSSVPSSLPSPVIPSFQLPNSPDHPLENRPIPQKNNTKAPTFLNNIQQTFTRFGDFRGRSSQKEFRDWVGAVFLFYFLVPLVVLLGIDHLVGNVEGMGLVFAFFLQVPFLSTDWGFLNIALLLPTISLMVRRLHDQDLSGYRALQYLLVSVGVGVSYVGIAVFQYFSLFGFTEGKFLSVPMQILLLVGGLPLTQFFVMKHFFFKPGTEGQNRFGLPK